MADEGNAITECSEDNNTAFAVIDPAEGASVPEPDLTVSSSDISITPSNVIEGQPAVISAVVHNTGEADVINAKVSFYDGDPANSGMLIGSVAGLNIKTGSGAVAEMTWNTLGQSGINFIYAKADPQNQIEESNENNNTSLIQVEVMPPVKPDITSGPGDMVFSAAGPTEGDPLTLTVTVRNNGTGAGNVRVELYDNGTLSGTHTIFRVIPFRGHEQAVFNIDTVGIPGSHTFSVVLDPDNTIDEQNEGNNVTSADLMINSIGLGLTVSADKASYNENEDVLITANITDLQDMTRDLSVDARIYDSAGALAAALDPQLSALDPAGTQAVTFTWNTGSTLVGDYNIKVTAYDTASNPLARQSTPITIASSKGLTANITMDKISYVPNETAEITSTIINNSVNTIYENITAVITVKDPAGQMLYTERKPFSALYRSYTTYKTYWNTGTNIPGDYPVSIELKDGNNVLFAKTGNITIASTMDPSELLAGMISVNTQSLLQGEPAGITYSVTNIGNIDLAQVDLSILTVHVTALTIHDTLSDQAALLIGDTYANTQSLDTQNYTAKDYLVILRANIQGEEATLASTYFRVEGAPSAPSLYLPVHGEDVETLLPELSVNNASDPNDDDLTYEFELYSDSGLTNLIASSGVITEGQNTTSWTAPLELQENMDYYWRARAYDGLLCGEWMVPASFRVNVTNDTPTAPTLSSPADSSEVDTYTPVLAVSNAYDPDSGNLTYNFEVALDPGFTRIAASGTGIFEGQGTTSWQVPLDLNEDTYYYWRAQADDWLTEGLWMSPAVFFVNVSNNGPVSPVVVAPVDGSEVTAVSTGITISNSTDPEGDALNYEFELDTVITFDSADLVSVTALPAGTGMTTWHVDGLQDNSLYFVRARANDGLAGSDWSYVTSFFVNTANDAPSVPVPANPSDGAGVNVFNPVLSVRNSTDIDRDPLTYEFEIYADAAMTVHAASAAGIEETEQVTSWTAPVGLTENSTYFWRARAYDGGLFSGWTTLSSFMVNTANDAPAAPLLVSPAEGSSLGTPYPALSIFNAPDPDADTLTYDFEIYSGGNLVRSITEVPENSAGITSVVLADALAADTVYTWRARAYDGDRCGAWMDMASFSVHLPSASITATIDFDPDTLNKKSNGKWVVVYIELPSGHDVHDIDISSILLEGAIPAEAWPYNISDHDKDNIPDLMVKFRRADVISVLPAGDSVAVTVTGKAGDMEFEGVDAVRVVP
ncbi:MAG: hypothetical protein OEU95_04185 [Nitrospirota bacterium]|nr:hypothetical protein [Nitrospirota bacterium]